MSLRGSTLPASHRPRQPVLSRFYTTKSNPVLFPTNIRHIQPHQLRLVQDLRYLRLRTSTNTSSTTSSNETDLLSRTSASAASGGYHLHEDGPQGSCTHRAPSATRCASPRTCDTRDPPSGSACPCDLRQRRCPPFHDNYASLAPLTHTSTAPSSLCPTADG